MKPISAALLGVAGTLGVLGIGAALFVESGLYNMGADDHHTKPVFAIIEQLRERSIAAHARGIPIPSDLASDTRITAGAQRYTKLCVGCHLAPGVAHSEIRTGLYPHPPNLAQADLGDARKTFWVIKHGLKMSAMPAWGKTLDDAEVWDLVAFVQEMPRITAERYQGISTEPTGLVETAH